MTGYVMFGAGDVVAQLARPHDELDYERSAKVGMLGIFLNGLALHVWYRVLDRAFGTKAADWGGVLKKCAADQAVYAPVACGSFLTWAAVIQGGGVERVHRAADNNLRQSFFKTWAADCMVWPFANVVGFRFVPINYRPTFIGFVQLGWQSYMSTVGHAHAAAPETSADPAPAVPAGRAKAKAR
eukprot:g8273.t1